MRVIKSNLLIDGTGNPPISAGVVCLDEDGRICQVGSSDAVPIPPNSEIIDWSRYTVLPGFVDSHTHLTLSHRSAKGLLGQFFHTSPSLLAIRGFLNLMCDLRSGVTTTRAMGDGAEGLEIIIRDAIKRGEIPGPRLLACAEIRPSHGTGTKVAGEDGIWEIRKAIRKGIREGVDVIKVFATNIVPGNQEDDFRRGDLTTIASYTKDEIVAAVEETHRVGFRVAVHALGGPALRWALEAGADTIEHAALMEEEDIELFLKYGAYLSDPNLQLFFDEETGYEKSHFGQIVPQWGQRKVQHTRQLMRRVMPKALKAGVKFVLGSDPVHGELWREAVHFVKVLGASEMQAVQSLTKHSADALGLSEEVGTLEKGKIADLVAIEGNPLDNIESLRNVKAVVKEGTIVPREDMVWT